MLTYTSIYTLYTLYRNDSARTHRLVRTNQSGKETSWKVCVPLYCIIYCLYMLYYTVYTPNSYAIYAIYYIYILHRKLTLSLTEGAKTWLAERGYDPVYGARPLKRTIQREVETPLAQVCRHRYYQYRLFIHDCVCLIIV